jgi:ferrous iron transport protein A
MKKKHSLSQIKQGIQYTIAGFSSDAAEYAEKLTKMGFVDGTPIQLAPVHINDPLVFEIRGSRIALRKYEAQQIIVQEK